MSEDYLPLDAIRSSYGMQRRPLKMEPLDPITGDLFDTPRNPVSDTAWACVVYSLVPYLGILFVPLAFITGKMATVCVVLSFVILAIQIFLWWLLYIIPEIGI
jgi:hypothetical protein